MCNCARFIFKYYVINLGGGWGVWVGDDFDDAGGGSKIVENLMTYYLNAPL